MPQDVWRLSCIEGLFDMLKALPSDALLRSSGSCMGKITTLILVTQASNEAVATLNGCTTAAGATDGAFTPKQVRNGQEDEQIIA